MTKTYRTEHEFQREVYLHVNRNYPEIRRLFWAIPNGDLRNKSVANRLKLEGVLPGVPDMQLCINGQTFFFEMKRSEKESLSKTQKIQIPILRAEGFPVYVIKGSLEAFFYALVLCHHKTKKPFTMAKNTLKCLGLTKEEFDYEVKVFNYLFDMEEGRVKLTKLAKKENLEKFKHAVVKFSAYQFDIANGFKIDFTTSRKDEEPEYVRKIMIKPDENKG